MADRQVRVISSHEASYEDPIRIRRGDELELSGRSDTWDGHIWLWAVAQDGRSGWVPDTLPDRTAAGVTARRDYDAAELTCARSEVLLVHEESHGWGWCENEVGQCGWVPLQNLAGR